MSESHHILPRQRVAIAVSRAAVKQKIGKPLSDGEQRLLGTPLSRVLDDNRNIIRLSRKRHHRAHNGFERLDPDKLPRGIYDFAATYGLEAALEHELKLMRGER